MKKETINTFGEGMNKDLHPLNTPNNILTDALNATLITYDGDEFILQNDMGNGKVESAKLPSGYIPVGIKENGGIIYVASYNPLLGKSQIGSFPSPERQISTKELGREFGLNNSLNTSNSYIRLDIYDGNKKELYKLNPGDRFVLYSSGIKSFISNYKNTVSVNVGVVDKENNISYLEEGDYFSDRPTEQSYIPFTGKTSGYLCIIIELLTIDTFEVIRDIKVTSGTINDDTDNSDLRYSLTFKGGYSSKSNIGVNQFRGVINGSRYHSTSDLRLGFNDITSNDVINYKITPICNFGELSSFSTEGNIDFSVFGTSFCKLTEWRYFVDEDYLQLG